MQSRFSRTDRGPASPRRRRRSLQARGFTLLELLITLALAGLLVGVVTVGLGRMTRASENRAALIGIVNALTVARVEAMRTSRPVRVAVEVSDGRVLVREGIGDRVSRYPVSGIQLRDGDGRPATSAAAEYDTLGRTRERVWRFEEAPHSPGTGPAQVGAAGAVRIWRIEFDPVSGAPVLRSPGESGARSGAGAR